MGLYVRGVPLITLHESKPFANVARMTDRTRDTDGAPTSTPLARWLDSVVPALFASDAALSRAAGVPQANVSRWRRGTTPEVPSLVKLANATGTSVETLLRIAGYRPPGGTGKDADS